MFTSLVFHKQLQVYVFLSRFPNLPDHLSFVHAHGHLPGINADKRIPRNDIRQNDPFVRRIEFLAKGGIKLFYGQLFDGDVLDHLQEICPKILETLQMIRNSGRFF